MTKDQLREYAAIKRELQNTQGRLEELSAAMYAPKAQKLTGTPSAPSPDNAAMELMVIQRQELLDRYLRIMAELAEKLQEVETSISGLASPAREVLRCRYIDGLTWEQVCVKLNYSWRQVHRIHADALEKLKEKGQG